MRRAVFGFLYLLATLYWVAAIVDFFNDGSVSLWLNAKARFLDLLLLPPKLVSAILCLFFGDMMHTKIPCGVLGFVITGLILFALVKLFDRIARSGSAA